MVHMKYLAQSPAGTVKKCYLIFKLYLGGCSCLQIFESLPYEIGIKLPVFMRTSGDRTEINMYK